MLCCSDHSEEQSVSHYLSTLTSLYHRQVRTILHEQTSIVKDYRAAKVRQKRKALVSLKAKISSAPNNPMMDQNDVDSLMEKVSELNDNNVRLTCYEEEAYSETKNMVRILDSANVELTRSRTSGYSWRGTARVVPDLDACF